MFVMDSGTSGERITGHPLVAPFVDTLQGTGHAVKCIPVCVAGKSEGVAVNRILVMSKLEGYDYVFKVDDDHVLPPDSLELLVRYHREAAPGGTPVLLSGVTPWMRQVFDGAASPYDNEKTLGDVGPRGITFVDQVLNGGEVALEIGHFNRYAVNTLAPTELASAANFFLVPDVRILWSDVGESSKYADAMWFIQLRKLLGYKLFFLTGLNVWHAAALSGGVREEEGNFQKTSPEDAFRELLLAELFGALGDES